MSTGLWQNSNSSHNVTAKIETDISMAIRYYRHILLHGHRFVNFEASYDWALFS